MLWKGLTKMYLETINKMVESSINKKNFINKSYKKYFASSFLAGMYVGFGVMLAYSIGSPFVAAASPGAKAIMSASFGIALTLVIFAGAELFTGNTMVMALGYIEKKVSLGEAARVWGLSYLGNLVGSVFLAFLTIYSGLLDGPPQSEYILKVTAGKMSAPVFQLFLRGILCNMLVCLAIWACARVREDISKIFIIWWCLYGFVGAGFEHNIANMTTLSMGLLLPHDPTVISVGKFIYNLVVVTAGNIVGGTFLVGVMYWYISKE